MKKICAYKKKLKGYRKLTFKLNLSSFAHFKCQTELFHSTNLPSLCRRLFSIGLFVPYCANLFKTHTSLKKAKNTHTGSGHCNFLLSAVDELGSYPIWYVALRNVFQSFSFLWWTLRLPGTQQTTVPVLSHRAIYFSSYLLIYLSPFTHPPLFPQ